MRKFSKMMAAVIAAVATTACMAVSVGAAHTNPTTGMPCNNTYYYLNDTGSPSVRTSTHRYNYADVCTVTYYSYLHSKYCSSCGYYFGTTNMYECTVHHTCTNYTSKSCSGIHA